LHTLFFQRDVEILASVRAGAQFFESVWRKLGV
jgi:hypothetical protein